MRTLLLHQLKSATDYGRYYPFNIADEATVRSALGPAAAHEGDTDCRPMLYDRVTSNFALLNIDICLVSIARLFFVSR